MDKKDAWLLGLAKDASASCPLTDWLLEQDNPWEALHRLYGRLDEAHGHLFEQTLRGRPLAAVLAADPKSALGPLPGRTRNALDFHKVKTVGELIRLPVGNLWDVPRFGEGSLEDLRHRLWVRFALLLSDGQHPRRKRP